MALFISRSNSIALSDSRSHTAHFISRSHTPHSPRLAFSGHTDRLFQCLFPIRVPLTPLPIVDWQDLQIIPSKVTTWEDWRINQQDTLILSDDTGFSRDYDNDPYLSYQSSNEIRFPVNNYDGRLPGKSFVIGIRINNRSTAYSMDFIDDLAGPYEDEIDGGSVQVFPGAEDTAYITDDEGELLPGILLYWFAWSAFNPNTSVVD